MSISPKHTRHIASYFLGVYLMVLGVLAVHPWHGEEIHHDEHVCPEATHYHKTPEVCQLCDITLAPANYCTPYTIEQVYPAEWTVLYLSLQTNTLTTDYYHCLLRGPPSA